MDSRKRVAVVGSGVSGIGAFWALKNTKHEVHLFEASDRLGGHTNTVKFSHKGLITDVDTGFIVLNSATYPNFIAFLKEIGVSTVSTEMTFGISRDQGVFEWAGTSLSAVFAQKWNIFKPRVWHMLFDIVRFNQFALDLLATEEEVEEDPNSVDAPFKKSRKQESIGTYLDREGYSEAFREDYLIPMTACVWSTTPEKCSLDFPALTLVRFLWNHHLLTTISERPEWRTIKEGSKLYIDAVMDGVSQHKVHLEATLRSLKVLESGQVRLLFQNGSSEVFDHVILATHGNQAMSIMEEAATEEERAILSAFETSANTAVLHSDKSLMPKRRVAWSSWNYITTSSEESVSQVCLTYWMNLLQHIPEDKYGDVLVTLNPLHRPNPALIQGEWTYHHPLYNAAAIRSQSLLPKIQNRRGISYAGAWTKYGFHEDGFSSGIKVAAEHLGAQLPFEFVDSTFSRGRKPVLGWRDRALRIVLQAVQLLILLCRFMVRGTVQTRAVRKSQ